MSLNLYLKEGKTSSCVLFYDELTHTQIKPGELGPGSPTVIAPNTQHDLDGISHVTCPYMCCLFKCR